jgi:SlyX protein
MPRTMQDGSDIDKRLTELEIKASLAEDLVDRLNEIIIGQQARIDVLARELARLAQQRSSGQEPEFRSLRDELPPHY